jgi:hypothetical protein
VFEQSKDRLVMPDNSHDFFDQLCAMSAAGQISSEEQRILGEHLPSCASCKELVQQYNEIVSQTSDSGAAFHALASPTAWDDSIHPSEHQRARARLMLAVDEIDAATGSRATSSVTEPHFSWHPQLLFSTSKLAACVATVCLVGAVSFGSWLLSKRMSVHRQATPQASLTSAELIRRIDELRQELATAQSERNHLEVAVQSAADQSERLKAENNQLRQERSQIESAASRQTSDYANLNNHLRLLQSSLDAAQSSNINLENERKDLLTQVADLTTALRDSRDEVTRVGSRNQELTQQSLTQVRYVQRQQKLLGTDHALRDILGARSLRIIDVYDVGSKGDFELPFGRIFYTEGKSLIFYAFDLDLQKGLKPGVVFQAWGLREQAKETPHRLGAFYMDDPIQNRWILKVDDARLLSRIDYVFVTDSRKEGSKPRGKPLLSAFLDSRINHP